MWNEFFLNLSFGNARKFENYFKKIIHKIYFFEFKFDREILLHKLHSFVETILLNFW
jgi:hypothetical protein